MNAKLSATGNKCLSPSGGGCLCGGTSLACGLCEIPIVGSLAIFVAHGFEADSTPPNPPDAQLIESFNGSHLLPQESSLPGSPCQWRKTLTSGGGYVQQWIITLQSDGKAFGTLGYESVGFPPFGGPWGAQYEVQLPILPSMKIDCSFPWILSFISQFPDSETDHETIDFTGTTITIS